MNASYDTEKNDQEGHLCPAADYERAQELIDIGDPLSNGDHDASVESGKDYIA